MAAEAILDQQPHFLYVPLSSTLVGKSREMQREGDIKLEPETICTRAGKPARVGKACMPLGWDWTSLRW